MNKPSLVVSPQNVRSVLGLARNATKQQVWFTVARLVHRRESSTASGSAAVVRSQHARDAIALAVVGEKIFAAERVGRRAS